MAYELGASVVVEPGFHSGLELLRAATLAMDDASGDWSFDLDYALHVRSALELTREQLGAGQRDLLERVDAAWRASPQRFNSLFGRDHAEKVVKTELRGWVVDAKGKTPAIPRDHWWWSPLEVG